MTQDPLDNVEIKPAKPVKQKGRSGGRGVQFNWEIITTDGILPLCFPSTEEADKYVRGSNNQYAHKSGRYYCRFHENCRHFLKTVENHLEPHLIHLYQHGHHTTKIKIEPHGIPNALRPYFDKYLKLGCFPRLAVSTVREELLQSPELLPLLEALDTENKAPKKLQRKIQTRKSDLKQQASFHFMINQNGVNEDIYFERGEHENQQQEDIFI